MRSCSILSLSECGWKSTQSATADNPECQLNASSVTVIPVILNLFKGDQPLCDTGTETHLIPHPKCAHGVWQSMTLYHERFPDAVYTVSTHSNKVLLFLAKVYECSCLSSPIWRVCTGLIEAVAGTPASKFPVDVRYRRWSASPSCAQQRPMAGATLAAVHFHGRSLDMLARLLCCTPLWLLQRTRSCNDLAFGLRRCDPSGWITCVSSAVTSVFVSKSNYLCLGYFPIIISL